MDFDECLLAAAQESAAIVDMQEGHFLVAAFVVVALDDFGEQFAISEEHAANPGRDNAVVDDDGRNRIRGNLHDVLIIKLIVEDDGAVDVGRNDLLNHRKGLFVRVRSRKQG